MKKALVCILSLALLLVLTACGKAQAEQPAAEPEPPDVAATTPEPSAEPTTPEPVSDTVPAAPSENGNTQAPAETATPETAISEPISEPDETNTKESLLEVVFQGVYDRCADIATETLDEHLKLEVQTLTETGPMMMKLPDEYDTSYLEWRVFTYGTDFKQGTSETQESQNTNQTAQAAPKQNTTTATNKGTTTPTQNQGTTQATAGDPDRMLGGKNGGATEDGYYNPREALYAGMTEEEIQAKMDETIQHIIDSGAIIQGS